MPRTVSVWHLIGDAVMIMLAFLLAHVIRFGTGWIPAPLGAIPLMQWMVLGLSSLPLWLTIAALHGLYYTRLKQAFSSELGAVTHAAAEGLVATVILTFMFRGLPDSRLALLMAFVMAWAGLAVYRGMVRKARLKRPRAAVIGDSPVAEYLRRHLSNRATRFDLAFASEDVGDIDADDIDVLFCDMDKAAGLWEKLPRGPQEMNLFFLPGGDATASAALSVATVEGVPTLALKSAADLKMMRRAKRIVDITGSLALIILTSPFWLFAILGIVLTMPGPLFFSHNRVGLNGRMFKLLKFRSMVRDAHKMQVNLEGFDDKYKLKNDPRITRFGALLRKLSLDELPQLVNILRGDLSLVGPRPVVEAEIEKYGHWGTLLTTVPPGLTGLWQVSGRSDTTYQERIDFDLYYINNWNPGLDFIIMLRTIPAVLSRKGAY